SSQPAHSFPTRRASDLASLRGRSSSRPIRYRFSQPESFSATEAYCPVSPITRRSCRGWRTTSYPATVACPAVGGRRVDRIRTSRSEEHTSELQSREKLV